MSHQAFQKEKLKWKKLRSDWGLNPQNDYYGTGHYSKTHVPYNEAVLVQWLVQLLRQQKRLNGLGFSAACCMDLLGRETYTIHSSQERKLMWQS